MSPDAIDKSINTAAISLEMEGFIVKNVHKDLCRRLLSNEISLAEYIALVTPQTEEE